MNAPAGEPRLTFDWRGRERFPFVLLGCVLASLLAHAATFFLFRVVYPQRVTILNPPPQISLLTPSSPENVALLHEIEAQDRSLVSGVESVTPPGLLTLRYRPSYEKSRATPLGVPAETSEPVRFPPANRPIDFIRSAEIATAPPPAAIVRRPTHFGVSGPLAARAVAGAPALTFSQSSELPLEPARWLAGVNALGEIQFAFLQQSSGNPAFDDLAAAHLLRLPFSRGENEVVWGFVTVTWGDDAFAENPNSKFQIPNSP